MASNVFSAQQVEYRIDHKCTELSAEYSRLAKQMVQLSNGTGVESQVENLQLQMDELKLKLYEECGMVILREEDVIDLGPAPTIRPKVKVPSKYTGRIYPVGPRRQRLPVFLKREKYIRVEE